MDLRTTVTLLPTPTAQAAKHAGGSRFGGGNGDASNLWQIHHLLLPTPLATDGTDDPVTNCASVQAICDGSAGRNPRLSEMAAGYLLLPTPRTRDGKGATSSRSGDNKHDLPSALADPEIEAAVLPTEKSDNGWCEQCWMDYESPTCLCDEYGYRVTRLPESSWGKYEPAIRRWESLTSPAPPPTEPNKNGNPRLAAAFSEWLMGWPEGWVTDPDIGISRNEQLRIVGNGVCSQQAEAAIRYLLEVPA